MQSLVAVVLIPKLTSLEGRSCRSTRLYERIVTSLGCKSSKDVSICRGYALCVLLSIVDNVAVLDFIKINSTICNAQVKLTVSTVGTGDGRRSIDSNDTRIGISTKFS